MNVYEAIRTRRDVRRFRPDPIPDEVLLRAHRVRGGLRRLTNHFFEDESPRTREHVYRQLWLRTQRLLAREE